MTFEVELAGLIVDGVLFETKGDLVIANRDPEPGETDVDALGSIRFNIIDTTGSTAPDPALTNIFITTGDGPEVLVYDGSAFQPGWAGPNSYIGVPRGGAATGGDIIEVEVDPTLIPFDSLAVITIRVETSNGAATLDESWSYVIEDLTGPVLSSASPLSKDTVEVDFDEALGASALIAANYEIERMTEFPAASYLPTVIGVERISSSSYILTLDDAMTQGAPYRVIATGVEDDDGNAIAAPFNSTEFTGFVPDIPANRSFDYFRMLGQTNRDQDVTQELEAFANAIQDSIDQWLCSIDEWSKIHDPDQASEPFLDAMLLDLANPFDFDLSVNDKRRLIRVLVDIYRQKGTEPGIINVVRFFTGIEITIQAFGDEGWDLGVDELGETTVLGPGTSFALYSFEILAPVALTAEEESRIEKLAEYMKPARTHLIRIVSPATPAVIDHLELGLSELGTEWILHE